MTNTPIRINPQQEVSILPTGTDKVLRVITDGVVSDTLNISHASIPELVRNLKKKINSLTEPISTQDNG